uniref:CRAL-TRIO domain-containing protein n=1 Tax=Haptolina brevifila TaxID=156173 RepID=A0A7S2NKA4_9EUKA|mmetsp:Transcript_81382/g.161859  ORF Transcript_81382/g.161859 Transcript_81382/m.161859 type:complete len:182 (+) Transcript_81382:947-1492(+)
MRVHRYTRTCIKGSRGGGEDEVTGVVLAVIARLGATACWRVQVVPPHTLQESRRSTLQEVEWLDGRDSFGRPTAVFYADRHFPGEIEQSEWVRFVIHNAEAAVLRYGLNEGPGGQFNLIVDRSSSGIRNQDPALALAVLPTVQDHYPGLLGRVFIAPINPIFYLAWNVVRLFLKPATIQKV